MYILNICSNELCASWAHALYVGYDLGFSALGVLGDRLGVRLCVRFVVHETAWLFDFNSQARSSARLFRDYLGNVPK